jgi:hypothetical protein
LVPIAKGQERQYELLPPTLVWSIKQTDNVKKAKLRLTVAGNRQRCAVSDGAAVTSNPDAVSVRLSALVGSLKRWNSVLLDVKTAFLTAPLHEAEQSNLGIRVPPSLRMLNLLADTDACAIRMSMYGLKSSPAAWSLSRDRGIQALNKKLTNDFVERSDVDENVWVVRDKVTKEMTGLLIVYVDDFFITAKDGTLQEVTKLLSETWTIGRRVDLPYKPASPVCGEFLGMEITRYPDGTTRLTQGRFVDKLLATHNMATANPTATPMEDWSEPELEDASCSEITLAQELIGGLQWLSTKTRLDISYATGVLASLTTKCPNWVVARGKRILRYLAGTRDYGLSYDGKVVVDDDNFDDGFDDLRRRRNLTPRVKNTGLPLLQSFSDASFAPHLQKAKDNDGTQNDDLARAVSGLVISYSGGILMWRSSRQSTMTASTTEAELNSLLQSNQVGLGVKDLVEETLGKCSLRLYCDAQATIALVRGGVCASIRTRYLALRAVIVRSALLHNLATLKYTPTKEMVADVLTKPLARPTFSLMVQLLKLDGQVAHKNVVAKTMTTGGVATEMAQAIAKALVNAGLDALRQQQPNEPTSTFPRTATANLETCPTTCPTTLSFTTTQATSTLTWQGLLLGAVAGVGFVNFVQLVRDKLCKRRRGTRTRQTQETSTQEEPMVRDVGSMSQCSYDRGEGEATHGRFRYLGRLQVDEFQEHGVPYRRTSRRGA